MKKTLIILLITLFCSPGFTAAQEKAKDPNQLFYKANAYYESGDYDKAVENYVAILDSGIESGNVYYNIGNGFLKLGKTGYAILSYEKANKFIPGDGDLKSNLEYARSLTDSPPSDGSGRNLIVRIIRRPFRDLNLNAVAICTFALYLAFLVALAISIGSRKLAIKLRFITPVIVIVFFFALASFALRYYEEKILSHGIVVQKEAECRYEPIDKSTVFYKLAEGNKVVVLKTRNGWRQVRRADGKVSWVKKEAVELI
ncbi:MAG: SH3 domain-containing protein [Candidatus Omnitrophota bacterium]|jgi:tetratricopeptide (TPR) repeat protein